MGGVFVNLYFFGRKIWTGCFRALEHSGGRKVKEHGKDVDEADGGRYGWLWAETSAVNF